MQEQIPQDSEGFGPEEQGPLIVRVTTPPPCA